MDDISVKINDDANKIEIEVDKNDVHKIFTFDDIDDEPHSGKPITTIEISPNEKYLITYSKEDDSISGWNVEDMDKVQLKFHQTVKINNNRFIYCLCVSDDKKLAYNCCLGTFNIIDMNNKNKKIALSFDKDVFPYYFTFNLKGEFILYSSVHSHRIIWIYSTQTKNNKWECKRFYKIPKYYKLISISKYDKVYLFSNDYNLLSNDYICEWNINTEKGVKIFVNNKDKKFKTHRIGIFSNEKFNILKVNDKIIVYSIELGIPIASLDINDDIQFYNFMNHTGLFLLPSLFYYTSDKEIKYCWNSKYKNMFNQILIVEPTDVPIDEQTKVMFGILNEHAWKSKFYENMSKTKVIECDDDDRKTYKLSNVHLYMDTVYTLFQNAKCECKEELITESIDNLIKWKINAKYHGGIRLEVFKKINTEWELIGTRIENYPYKLKYPHYKLIASSLFNNNGIVILTIFDSNNKKCMEILQHNTRIFSKSTLPLPNYDIELLTFAIKEHKLELIDEIYKKCMTYFKEDPNNKSFLSIITSTMPILDEYYPEYILKYSSETNMIIDSSFYSIEHRNKNLHLYSFFQSPQIANLSKSLLYTKCYYKFGEFYETAQHDDNLFNLLIIFYTIQPLIILLTLPLYLATFYILSKYNFINNIYPLDVINSSAYFHAVKIFKYFQKDITTTPTIIFMIPYINFVNYSKDYNWFLELIRPQPSPFTKSINRNIYKTWNGEALINFKWNAFGKYYYAIIWILFMTLLGCFTAAATIPQQYINEEIRQQLFIASIILGFIHLIFEIRQFFYNITKWFYNFWN
ncbi:hypothetical protein C1646_809525, partial [Rhizophagus diaphanus]